ncbi:P-loop containing nucleoside triphosphate hydrolase protein [Fimicolochytrium jonesii]|uniref:P-loop containing nucleoside triphosphate hydrolase protein n=1 Tax=Fimicolochytrium jonesii TaxID=1396493 RepID=UPI0022FEE539|nr:P-loop containing nucleoside triphosphate hydrolase protein [Fimicolochytrium jonesii]KAI8821378.1 P-loop containing nucleoside triphosphate hydrolase protein [Fimicolochytrium jonesii]
MPPVAAMDSAPEQDFDQAKRSLESVARIKQLLNDLYTCETSDDCVAIAADLGEAVQAGGLHMLRTAGVLDNLSREAQNKKSGLAREGALLGLHGLVRVIGRPIEPHFLPLLPILLDSYADKGQPVREAAEMAVNALLGVVSPYSTRNILPYLFEAMTRKWQTMVGALEALSKLAATAPDQIALALPEIIPNVTERLHDTKAEVEKAATKCMTDVCAVANNPDIAPHLPMLVSCMARPTEVPDCVQKLSATTFVAEVTGPALAIMVPLLVRALNERSMAVVRPTTVITDNLCKLVRDPAEAGQFLPQLLPGLDKLIETAAFPEIRQLATVAKNTLMRAGGDVAASGADLKDSLTIESVNQVLARLRAYLAEVARWKDTDPFAAVSINHVGSVLHELLVAEDYHDEAWQQNCSPYLAAFIPKPQADAVLGKLATHYRHVEHERRLRESGLDKEEGEELCSCDFSLAYGGMMLLNHTTLRLMRGRRYGLCGHNGAGKSTLMRAISKGKVENFPPQDQLRAVLVEHSLQGEDTSLPVLDFVATDKRLAGISRDAIEKALRDVQFDDERIAQQVGSLSGGWKMKLELARAILMNADLLLLDEPTNHLDVGNVAWLVNYLTSQPNLTVLVVSHDSGFLDNVCTDIIHYERKKLVFYKGNLSKFVERRPEAKSYYTLSTDNVKFAFPPPAFLQGINSKTKSILKMTDATYTYPGAPKPSLSGVSVGVSLSSRVAIIGPNGAGKSTLIKVLTGEAIPQEGQVWKHPNLRVGYVAQHAFHHLDQHLEKTPNQYIQWRYQGGEDREVLEKESRKLTEQDEKQMETPIDIDGSKRRIEYLIGRSKLKKSFQYEVKWVGLIPKHNTWVPREKLLELGFQKLVQAFDDREASREGQGYRELSPSVIRKHIEDVGLDGDIADHNAISGLSGGQKVKVVIAAAMWNNPHMLVLDEPTNYLDRDSLGGLAVAIRDWGGAVVMISHNEEFVGALCPEVWNVEAGRLTRKNKNENGINADAFEDHAKEEAAMKKIEAKVASKPKKKKMTRNDVKAREVRRRARHMKWLVEGGVKEPDTDSD